MRIDVHQHVWTRPLLDALAGRAEPPLVRRERGLTVLHSAGELPYVIDTDSETRAHRRAQLDEDGLDLALVAISSPIGIEALPRREALPLIDAHLEGVRQLGEGFAAWGPVALDAPDPAEVDERLAGGCIGISLPAGALAAPDRLLEVAPLLRRASDSGAPVFVHPGRAPGQRPAPPCPGEPLWWRALTDYVRQMQAAWLTFTSFARREHPELRLVFAMLAGAAPLQAERLESRGARCPDLADPLIFYETSSYGPAAVGAVGRVVGQDRLLYGSDRPVVDPARLPGDDRRRRAGGALLASQVPA